MASHPRKQRKISTGEAQPCVQKEKEILRIRAVEGRRFNGFKPGRVVCIDNLGWGFNLDQLEEQILKHLPKAIEVRFSVVHVPHLSKTYYGGWGCVEFESYQAAVEGLIILDSLYITLPNCSVSRPIIAHFPRWTESPCELAGEAIECGNLRKGKQMSILDAHQPFAAHFAQLNNMGSLGLEWAEKDEACREVKGKIKEKYKKLLIRTLKEAHRNETVDNAHQPVHRYGTAEKICNVENVRMCVGSKKSSSGTAPEPCTFWIRGVLSSVKTEEIEQWFRQFDKVIDIVRGEDPVSQQPNGHVLVTIERDGQAQLLLHQLDISLLLVGGVRPLQIQFAAGWGGPTGFEALFDEALEVAYGLDIGGYQGNECAVKTKETLMENEMKIAEACRMVLEECCLERAAIFQESAMTRGNLHKDQEKATIEECKKLEYLSRHIPIFKSGSAKRNMNDGNRDGRRQRKRR